MKKNEGYVLLRSLLTIAVILICAVAFYAALAVVVKQSGQLGSRMNEEFSFRYEKIMERIR